MRNDQNKNILQDFCHETSTNPPPTRIDGHPIVEGHIRAKIQTLYYKATEELINKLQKYSFFKKFQIDNYRK